MIINGEDAGFQLCTLGTFFFYYGSGWKRNGGERDYNFAVHGDDFAFRYGRRE